MHLPLWSESPLPPKIAALLAPSATSVAASLAGAKRELPMQVP